MSVVRLRWICRCDGTEERDEGMFCFALLLFALFGMSGFASFMVLFPYCCQVETIWRGFWKDGRFGGSLLLFDTSVGAD